MQLRFKQNFLRRWTARKPLRLCRRRRWSQTCVASQQRHFHRRRVRSRVCSCHVILHLILCFIVCLCCVFCTLRIQILASTTSFSSPEGACARVLLPVTLFWCVLHAAHSNRMINVQLHTLQIRLRVCVDSAYHKCLSHFFSRFCIRTSLIFHFKKHNIFLFHFDRLVCAFASTVPTMVFGRLLVGVGCGAVS